jgi:hypothetical protein
MAFSMFTGIGMDSIMDARSPWGVAAFRVVGAVWFDGYTAVISWFYASLVSHGAGKARGAYTSSMSVSLDGMEVAYYVFLVLTGMFRKNRVLLYTINLGSFNKFAFWLTQWMIF